MTELRVMKLRDDAVLPSRAHSGDAGLDLSACEEITIGVGERAAVGTGIAVEIPDGHAGLVVPRSGLALRHGISMVNAPGVIDAGYRGEVRVILLNTDNESAFTVEPGMRIAQLLVVPVADVDVVETRRGDGDRARRGRLRLVGAPVRPEPRVSGCRRSSAGTAGSCSAGTRSAAPSTGSCPAAACAAARASRRRCCASSTRRPG